MLQDDRAVQERVARVEGLLRTLESFPQPARDTAAEIVQALLDLYGQGLTRIMDRVSRVGGESVVESLAADELVAHLLLLHGLHPESAETRVQRALEEVRPFLASHGGDVELLGIKDGVARLRLQGNCSGCPSSTLTLKSAIEQAILTAAPDLDGIEAESGAASALPVFNFVDCPTPIHQIA